MKYDSNKKNKFTARFVRIAALFTLVVSFGIFAQAQTSPFEAQIERQRLERKRMEINNLVGQVVGGLIRMAVERGKRDKPLPGLLKPIAPPALASFKASSSVFSSPSLGGLLGAPTESVFAVAPSFASVQSGGLQEKASVNSNLPAANSNLQAIQSLNVAGNLGNGTFIFTDDAGKLYSVRLTGATRTTRHRSARRARR